jgi:O-acetyl-ADP-ribose deacetylase (regulator of RNase III)
MDNINIMEKKIVYINGDATSPFSKGNKIIAHICNDIGGWGKGFVLAISKKWKEPEKQYRIWYNSKENFTLGEVQFVQVDEYIYVANMIGQKGIKTGSKGPPIRYEAVKNCLIKLSQKAVEINASVHVPRIGCGLAGGKWENIEPLINKNLIEKMIDVFVYDYK